MKFFKCNEKNKVEVEEISEEKRRRELFNTIYDRKYVYCATCKKTIEVDGEKITYSHTECFLANRSYFRIISQFKQLTGEHAGKDLNVFRWSLKFRPDEMLMYFVDDNVEYEVSSKNCYDHESLSNHNINAWEIEKSNNCRNKCEIKEEIEKLSAKKKEDLSSTI